MSDPAVWAAVGTIVAIVIGVGQASRLISRADIVAVRLESVSSNLETVARRLDSVADRQGVHETRISILEREVLKKV